MVSQQGAVSLARGAFLSLRRLSTIQGYVSPIAASACHASTSRLGDSERSSRSGGVLSRLGTVAGAVGAVTAAHMTLSSEDMPTQCESSQGAALNPKEFIPFTLQSVHTLNHNTRIFRFQLPPGQELGLTVASCLVTRAPIGPPDESGKLKNVIRPYTPITQPHVQGYFDLLVKVYPTGVMSKHIDTLKPGDKLEFKGPIPKLPYTPNMKKEIGMVAGGTGITPMLQVIDAVLSNPLDNTQLSLVFANTSPSDVLLKATLDEYAARYPNFKVFYLVDRAAPKDGWKGGVGFVTGDILKKALPAPGPGSLVLVCGPPGMMKHVSGDKAKDKSQGELQGLLKELGYSSDNVYKF